MTLTAIQKQETTFTGLFQGFHSTCEPVDNSIDWAILYTREEEIVGVQLTLHNRRCPINTSHAGWRDIWSGWMVKWSFLIVSWFQDNFAPLDGGNAARRLLDNVSYVTEAVSSLSSPSSRALTNWITDQVAPDYWVPNSEITVILEIKIALITKFLKRFVLQKHQQQKTVNSNPIMIEEHTNASLVTFCLISKRFGVLGRHLARHELLDTS